MKRKVKIFSIIILMIITISTVMATVTNAAIIDPNEYDPNNSKDDVPVQFTNVIGGIAQLIQVIGIVLSVIAIGVLGIKYMTGTIEERAEYKKTMIPYLIGTILLVVVPTIIRLINDLVSQAFES